MTQQQVADTAKAMGLSLSRAEVITIAHSSTMHSAKVNPTALVKVISKMVRRCK